MSEKKVSNNKTQKENRAGGGGVEVEKRTFTWRLPDARRTLAGLSVGYCSESPGGLGSPEKTKESHRLVQNYRLIHSSRAEQHFACLTRVMMNTRAAFHKV